MIIIDLLLVLFFCLLSSFQLVFIEWQQFGQLVDRQLGWWQLLQQPFIVWAFFLCCPFRPFSCQLFEFFFVVLGL